MQVYHGVTVTHHVQLDIFLVLVINVNFVIVTVYNAQQLRLHALYVHQLLIYTQVIIPAYHYVQLAHIQLYQQIIHVLVVLQVANNVAQVLSALNVYLVITYIIVHVLLHALLI